ncbi:MAG: phosphatidylinositol mannoside acyltransferase [Actinomycetia bacterium]|jgi:KDO2-lipid IV(A) lauroyltransferase|nr:phosphatidylinositol mannoside acyltransferase [Actinomycetes bacterium]
MRHRLTDAAYAGGWSVVRHLPEGVADRSFRTLADQAWRRRGRGVAQLERNLARVVPDATSDELRELSREGMRSYLRYWREVFRLSDLTRQQIVDGFTLDGQDLLAETLASGRGVVVPLPHSGNWDLAGAWFTLTHARLTTVAERLQPESLFERFLAFRRSLGMEVLPLTGGEGPYGTLLDRLRGGGLVALLGDRDLTRAGVPVTFFGEPTRMPAGPAALALASGAALLPATLWFDGRMSRGRIHPEVRPPGTGTKAERVAAMTQSVADVFAREIAVHPHDWHMLQRLWVADLDPARTARWDEAGS